MRRRVPGASSNLKPYLLAGLIASSCLASPGFSQNAEAVADGQPWRMENPSGRTGEVTLHPDGTGEMAIRMVSMRVTWTADGDELCITSRMRGAQCVELQASAGGFAGMDGADPLFTLTRGDGER